MVVLPVVAWKLETVKVAMRVERVPGRPGELLIQTKAITQAAF